MKPDDVPQQQSALASDEELAELREWLSRRDVVGTFSNRLIGRVLARLDAAEECTALAFKALKIKDEHIAHLVATLEAKSHD